MTPVQEASLPAILAGRERGGAGAYGQRQDGSLRAWLVVGARFGSGATAGPGVMPDRELADQVSREIRRLARFIPNVKVLTLCGGVPLRPHLASLAHEPHIVVGTPGRILELIEKQALPLQAIKVLVLDEADRMLDMGFADAIDAIVQATPE